MQAENICIKAWNLVSVKESLRSVSIIDIRLMHNIMQ